MEGSIKELVQYRMERAKEMLAAAESNLTGNQIRTSLNRSYYAVFHAMRAVNCMEGFDSSKHSGVIAFFNKTFVKEGKLDKKLSAIVKDTSYLREKRTMMISMLPEEQKQKSSWKMQKYLLKALKDS